MQTSCKDFDQIRIQQPDACTWAELKKKFLYEINVQVHEIFKRKFFFGKYARNGLLGGEIIKWKNEKNRKNFFAKNLQVHENLQGENFFLQIC